MALNPPTFMLKVIWMTHFVLSSWALFSNFIEVRTYFYTHIAVLAFGMWALISVESTDAVIMFLATLLFSILNDVIILALYEPRGYFVFENIQRDVGTSLRNEYRFALGMCIANLILKPPSAFILYRIYQSRANGSEFDTGIPGLNSSPFNVGKRGEYNNIESSPGPTTYAVPSDPPQYQAPTY